MRSARRNRSVRRRVNPGPKLPGSEMTIHRRNTFALSRTATDTGRLISLSLSDFTGSELQSVFQLYKIEKVVVTWTLVNAPNNNANFPTLHSAPQNFTFITPTSLSEMNQYDKLKVFQFGPSKVQYKRTFTPSLLLDASSSAGTGQVIMPGATPWVSVNNLSTNFICANYWIQRYNATDATHTIEVNIDATIRLKGVR